MRRYYALLLRPGNRACLVKALDGETVLAETEFAWDFDESHDLKLAVDGRQLRAWIDGRLLFEVEDADRPLDGGAVAVICEEGTVECGDVFVEPVA